jgi:hypothetical protein
MMNNWKEPEMIGMKERMSGCEIHDVKDECEIERTGDAT